MSSYTCDATLRMWCSHMSSHCVLNICSSTSQLSDVDMILQKSSKANADLDLPPHLANKPPPSLQTTPSKPPSNHQQTSASRSGNSKPSVLPISLSDASQPLAGSKGKKAHDQGKGQGRLDEEESAASSRNSTPSRKAKQQRGQEGKGQSAKAETAAAPATAVLRKVVPIKLDRPSRQGEAQAGPSGAANQSQQAVGIDDAQVQSPYAPDTDHDPSVVLWHDSGNTNCVCWSRNQAKAMR